MEKNKTKYGDKGYSKGNTVLDWIIREIHSEQVPE